MFFFNHQNLEKENKKRFLQQAGIEISLDKIDNIDQIILKNLQTDEKFKDIRKKLYLHTFQQNILEKDIKTQIIEKCQTN